MSEKPYERLFCCACGKEVPPGTAARAVPALQPGTGGTGGSPRPHVWCKSCLGEEEREAKARPKPSEMHGERLFELHRYIWAVGEGRTDSEIRRHWGTRLWGMKLSTALRKLTEAGKIEKRGDRRVALCTPWQTPCHEPVTGLAHDAPIHEQQGPPEDKLDADRYGKGIPQIDLQDIHDRLKNIELLVLKLLDYVDHLVCMDNERGS